MTGADSTLEISSTPAVASYIRCFYVASGSQLLIEKWNGEGYFEK